MGSAGDCTANSCPVPDGFFSAPPNLAGNAIFLAAFSLLVPVNLYTGIRYKTPLYSSTIVGGLLFEVLGYVGRILLRSDTASRSYDVVSWLGLVWGATWLSLAISLVPAHVMVIYGEEFSLVSRPIYVTAFFLVFSMCTLAIQAVGVSLIATGNDQAGVRLFFGLSQGRAVLLANQFRERFVWELTF
jgi:hypothetical protein